MDATSLIDQLRDYTDQHGLEAALDRYAPDLATWPGRNTGCWFRVSPGHEQEEALQVPQVLRYCAANNLRPVKFYVVHAKSAFHGQHQADLERAVNDAQHGEFSFLVIWRSDRIERRHERGKGKPRTLLDTLAEFTDAGCKVLSVLEEHLGDSDFGSQVTTFVTSWVNWDKSQRISEDVKNARAEVRAKNANTDRIPWGYVSEGLKRSRQIHPTDECREYAPQIFQHCIDGWSCDKVAAWLDSEGVKPQFYGKIIKTGGKSHSVEKWHGGSVRGIIKNAAYAGRRITRPKVGERYGTTFAWCPAVIDMDTFQRANDALGNREKRGHQSKNPPLLTKLRCVRCGSPMYRIKATTGYFYRCYGSGLQRKGCGNMVPLAQTDIIIRDRIFMTSIKPYQTEVWRKGESWNSELQEIAISLQELLGKLGPLEYNRSPEVARLTERYADYERKNEQATEGHHEVTYYRKDGSPVSADEFRAHQDDPLFIATLKTEGDYFEKLDRDCTMKECLTTIGHECQRKYLAQRHRIEVGKVLNPPLEPGASVGLRVIIDGADDEVFPCPPTMKA